jgi:FlaA1/EpsC-like NDP-sugar epimerase
MIIWTQIANAVSMISPLICMLFHRKSYKTKNDINHKSKATRLLSIHIPISFCYHFISAFDRFFHLRNVLKIADLSMIHYYALRISQYFHQKRKVNIQTPLSKMSLCINSICIVRVCQGHEDTLTRIIGLYLCSYNALKDEENVSEIITIGSISSALFYFDEHLNNIGHSLFHIMLGLLHHKILVLL